MALAAFENEEIVASVASLWELSLKSEKKNALVGDPVTLVAKIRDGQGCVHAADPDGRYARTELTGGNP